MRRKVVIASFIGLCLLSFFILPPVISRTKRLISGPVEKVYKKETNLTSKQARALFPGAGDHIREDKHYVMQYTIKKVWSASGVSVDTVGSTTLIEKDL